MLNGNMSEAEGKIGINTIDHLDPEKQSGANTFLTLAENVANASNFVQRPEQATKTKRKYNTGGQSKYCHQYDIVENYIFSHFWWDINVEE